MYVSRRLKLINQKLYNKAQSDGKVDYANTLGGTLHRQGYSHIPPTSEPGSTLESITSQLEGVGNYCAAHAATTFIHLHTTSFHCAYCTLLFSLCQEDD